MPTYVGVWQSKENPHEHINIQNKKQYNWSCYFIYESEYMLVTI